MSTNASVTTLIARLDRWSARKWSALKTWIRNLGSIVSVGLDEMLTEIESRSDQKSKLNHEWRVFFCFWRWDSVGNLETWIQVSKFFCCIHTALDPYQRIKQIQISVYDAVDYSMLIHAFLYNQLKSYDRSHFCYHDTDNWSMPRCAYIVHILRVQEGKAACWNCWNPLLCTRGYQVPVVRDSQSIVCTILTELSKSHAMYECMNHDAITWQCILRLLGVLAEPEQCT